MVHVHHCSCVPLQSSTSLSTTSSRMRTPKQEPGFGDWLGGAFVSIPLVLLYLLLSKFSFLPVSVVSSQEPWRTILGTTACAIHCSKVGIECAYLPTATTKVSSIYFTSLEGIGCIMVSRVALYKLSRHTAWAQTRHATREFYEAGCPAVYLIGNGLFIYS